MSKANIHKIGLTSWVMLFTLVMALDCTDEQPVTLSDGSATSGIVGVVKPLGAIALIKIFQGNLIDSTYSDSISGIFQFDNLQAGFYSLEILAEGYGKYIENRIEVISEGITALGEIQLKPIPEQIVRFFPTTGSNNVPLTDPCGFEFTTFMDHNSVEENFTISPDIGGYFEWEENSNSSVLYFYPTSKFKAFTLYTFSLNTNAKTIYGDPLSFAVSSTFTTEVVKIETHTPEDGSNYIGPSVSVYVRFNTAMERSSVEQSFDINPEVDGYFIWQNNESFSYKPGALLATNTEYTISLSINTRDIHGTPLPESYSFSFTTEPLKIVYTNPANGATYINVNTSIGVTFNANMNQTSAENAFSVSPYIQGNFIWNDLTRMYFYPEEELNPDTWYTITINTNCEDIDGGNLPADFTFKFKTKGE